MLKSLVLLLVPPLVFTGLGYALGPILAPPPASATQEPVADATPEQLPLGRLITPVVHVARTTYLVIEAGVDVTSRDAAVALGTPIGIARLRDRALALLTSAAETPLLTAGPIDKAEVAAMLGRGLSQDFPAVASVTLTSMVTTDRPAS